MAEKTRSEKIKETKDKKKAEEAALNLERNISSRLDRFREFKHLYLNPQRTFKLGDEVIEMRANWNNVKIIAVEDDGLFYRVRYESTRNNYGQSLESVEESYVSWKDIVHKDHKFSNQVFNKREDLSRINLSFHNSMLESLISMYYYFGVDMSPEYQRGLVWTVEDKEALIDSIFQGIEIGKFVFIHKSFEQGEPGYEILDGKQRLSTIIEFVEDRFTYKGLKYSELAVADRQYFCNANITKGESRDQLTDKQKYMYFLRLNTRGKEQSVEHINKVKKMLTDLE